MLPLFLHKSKPESTRAYLFWMFWCLLLILFSGCGEDDTSSPVGPDDNECHSYHPYVIEFTDDKLPWPHHAPDLEEADYSDLQDDLWVINNFGQYQCGDEPESCYFHDGLDIVLDNGTPIYSMEAGVFEAKIGNDPYYWSLVILDQDEPEWAWIYTHITPIQGLLPGKVVPEGACLGTINFNGLEHLHLSRAYLKEGGEWSNTADWLTVSPSHYFIFEDENAPVIDTPFHFFKNESSERFPLADTTIISGEVDIVAGIRDPGYYARSKDNSYGDRLCVDRIEYEILREDEVLERYTAFDFSNMHLNTTNVSTKMATVFKFHLDMNPDFEFSDWNRFVSHYIITNSDGSGNFEPGEVGDREKSWDTARVDEAGERVYPNGEYTIRIYAWDNAGNQSVASSIVLIDNN